MSISDDFYRLLHNSRILVVDDDQDMCELIQERFGAEGYRHVDAVVSGAEALQRANEAVRTKNPYDLILLDLRLPGDLSGRDVYQNLCQTMDVPLMVISGINEKQAILDALRSGSVEEYLVKPLDMELLFLKCERILTRRIFNRQVQESHRRNQTLFVNILQVMAKVLEAKDPYTKFHSEKVAKFARQIAKRVGYAQRQMELIQMAGILHDFGKIGIKESLLNKAGGLTNYEYEAVKRHPLIASAILEPIEELRVIIRDIRHHHERWDGNGYPDGLRGEEIPLGARILCIADSYDAMTSSRAYHEPMNDDEAKKELVRCRGTQFDPTLVDLFLEILDENRSRRERIIRLREEIG